MCLWPHSDNAPCHSSISPGTSSVSGPDGWVPRLLQLAVAVLSPIVRALRCDLAMPARHSRPDLRNPCGCVCCRCRRCTPRPLLWLWRNRTTCQRPTRSLSTLQQVLGHAATCRGVCDVIGCSASVHTLPGALSRRPADMGCGWSCLHGTMAGCLARARLPASNETVNKPNISSLHPVLRLRAKCPFQCLDYTQQMLGLNRRNHPQLQPNRRLPLPV